MCAATRGRGRDFQHGDFQRSAFRHRDFRQGASRATTREDAGPTARSTTRSRDSITPLQRAPPKMSPMRTSRLVFRWLRIAGTITWTVIAVTFLFFLDDVPAILERGLWFL